MTKTKEKSAYYYAHGRRKTAVARVRLFAGTGNITVNEKPIAQYFPAPTEQIIYMAPFAAVGALKKFNATIKVEGSGKSGQLGAVVHGLSRALAKFKPEWRPLLKKQGLLTRDPRAKERRKFGLAQKARAKKQSPKR